MSRIRSKTVVAALLIVATAATVTAPVVGSVNAGGSVTSKAILKKAIL